MDNIHRPIPNRITKILEELPKEYQYLVDLLQGRDMDKLIELTEGKYSPVTKKYIMVYFREQSVLLGNPLTIQELAEVFHSDTKGFTRFKYELKQAGMVKNYAEFKQQLLSQIPPIVERLHSRNIITQTEKMQIESLARGVYDSLDLSYSTQLKPNLAVMLAFLMNTDKEIDQLYRKSFSVIYDGTSCKRWKVWRSIESIMNHNPDMFSSREQAEA